MNMLDCAIGPWSKAACSSGERKSASELGTVLLRMWPSNLLYIVNRDGQNVVISLSSNIVQCHISQITFYLSTSQAIGWLNDYLLKLDR